MYCKYYGFKERPFNVTSDPAFFFSSIKHKEALSHLIYGVSERKGLIVITGEIGTGKTTLCRFFLNQLDHHTKTAFILNPSASQEHLLEAILRDFGIKAGLKTQFSMVWDLNRFLLRESEKGNNVVLIIDESQNLNPEVLEQVRLLSNLETEKHKLLQIVLVGQPELNKKLELYDLRQLQQRVSVRYHISPLAENEIKEYLKHRLEVSGALDKVFFNDEAIKIITEFSAGTPRLINMICDRALLAGFNAETNLIDGKILSQCADELGAYFRGSLK